MSLQEYFPSVAWLYRAFTSRLARRTYFAMFLMLTCLVPTPRIRTFFRARKFEEVLAGLAQVKVDQTTEAELLKIVPYLARRSSYRGPDGAVGTWYSVEFTNEFDWTVAHLYHLMGPSSYRTFNKTAAVLGCHFLSFGALVVVRDGRVSSVRYAVNNWGGWPRALGNVVSAKSVHGPWLSWHRGFRVTSVYDENPQFRIESGRSFDAEDPRATSIDVEWTFDAPPEMISHAYQLDLSCSWGLRGCLSGRDMAPLLWQDEQNIQAEAMARLKSPEPCPDRVLAGRARYLPDMEVLLLEVLDSQREQINEEGQQSEEFNTDYRVVEVLRGLARRYPDKIRLRYTPTIPSPRQGGGQIANPLPPWHKAGDRVLFFTNHTFESCQLVPATPSALSVVRTTTPAPKRPEDEIPEGLM
jgi:hypothetical protein